MPELSLTQLALLVAAAFFAGTVDAIAGGGGLVTVPALLAAGLPPQLALGTNKGQSVFGSGAALLRFARAGLVDGRRARIAFPAGFAGSLGGAALVLLVRPDVLRPIVLGLLVAVGVFFALRRGPPRVTSRVRPQLVGVATAAIALAIGAYDGFFGPGTGTFLILAFSSVLGDALVRASAEAKVVNFASNLAAVALFASRGVIVWHVALPMAAAQALGGTLGAHLTVRGGDVLVRRVVLFVVLALVVKLASDMVRGA
ncbi:MAG TPA: TSUP family transporter [Anaeromyxobacteraceae bacterium]|nr:TSUP family transporter [Anaeromyxobacteraceae bacterium]